MFPFCKYNVFNIIGVVPSTYVYLVGRFHQCESLTKLQNYLDTELTLVESIWRDLHRMEIGMYTFNNRIL